MAFLGWLVAIVIAFIALATARNAAKKSAEYDAAAGHLRRVLENLAHSVAELRKHGIAQAEAATAPPPTPEPVAATAPPPPEPVITIAEVPPAPQPFPVAPEPLQPAAYAADAKAAEAPAPQQSELSEPIEQPAAAGAAEPPPPRPPPPPTTPPLPSGPWLNIDWEGLVGIKLFSGVAGIALVLAAIYFLKYSAEHGWLRPSIRAAIGLLTRAGLLVVCELRIAR